MGELTYGKENLLLGVGGGRVLEFLEVWANFQLISPVKKTLHSSNFINTYLLYNY